MAGKPYTVSEVNHPFPNEYACEGIPDPRCLRSAAGLGRPLLVHVRARATGGLEASSTGHFDLRPDPVKMAQLAAGALAFLRADLAPARLAHLRSYSEDAVLESLRLPHDERPFFTPGFDLTLPLRHRVRIRSLDGGATDLADAAPAGPILADTGEIAWRQAAKGTGLVTVDAPRTQAVVGFVPRDGVRLAHLEARIESGFAALTLSALEAQPIARSSRMLLVAGGRVSNAGQQWDAGRNGLEAWGGAPVVAEPVRGTVGLHGLEGAKQVAATPLDAAGQKLGPPMLAVRTQAAGWLLDLGGATAVWYAIDVQR